MKPSPTKQLILERLNELNLTPLPSYVITFLEAKVADEMKATVARAVDANAVIAALRKGSKDHRESTPQDRTGEHTETHHQQGGEQTPSPTNDPDKQQGERTERTRKRA